MKKILPFVASATLLATTLSADFIRVEAGAGAWMQQPKGEIVAKSSGFTGTDLSDKKEEAKGYAWLLVKHFVPIVPNLRVEYAEVVNNGTATGTFNGFTAPANTKTEFAMTQIDFAPYYNLLDNTAWITLDVGVDLKMINATYKADGVTIGLATNQNYEKAQSIVLPFGYVRTRVQVPLSGLGFEADVKYISYDENTAYDARAKVDYTFDITPLIQPGIEVGYRVQKFKTDQTADIAMDLDFAGVYAGAMLRF